MIDAEGKFEMQTGIDRFQELAKAKDYPLRLGLHGVVRCPDENDQQKDRGDAGDQPHRNVWNP